LYQVGRESCEDVTTEFVSQPPPCTGGNEGRGVSNEISIVEMVGSVRAEPKVEHHLRVEKARMWRRPTTLYDVRAPRVG
jgi:hypothetical protein